MQYYPYGNIYNSSLIWQTWMSFPDETIIGTKIRLIAQIYIYKCKIYTLIMGIFI